ncbi:MAG: hypothetical protein HFF34_07035 [Oscillospiraceae bacterium]|jgi:hypothetical protein|nr:hypothetical protein [Oscillospiraceae bacterium]
MTQQSFMDQLERIQIDLTSGISTLGLIHQATLDQTNLPECIDSLYVVYTYLQNVRFALVEAIESNYKGKVS